MISAISIGLLIGSISVVKPLFPPNAISGGTVIAELQLVSGNVGEIKILSGEEPFSGSTEAALKQWRADSSKNDRELIIVHFRQPNIYEIGDAKETVGSGNQDASLPYPSLIIHPAYPPNALGQGSVVLRADISDKGKVTNVQAIESMGVLTDAGIQAVKQWQFTPAKDKNGRRAASHAYVVIVFRYPNIAR